MNVSVIVPTFNRAEMLPETLESVLGQSHRALELIVIDDGSTDRTPDILRRVDDPRLRVIRQENRGKSAARNAGLDSVTGELVAFLDSDDIWATEHLERMVEVMRSEPEVDFLFADLHRFDESGVRATSQFDLVPDVRRLATRPAKGGDARILQLNPFLAFVPLKQFATWIQTVVIRTRSLGSIRFPPDMPLGQDYGFMLEVYRTCATCGFIDQPHAFIRRHVGNSYSLPRVGEIHSHAYPTLDALRRLEGRTRGTEMERVLSERIGRQHRSLGRSHCRRGELGMGAMHFLRAAGHVGGRLKGVGLLVLSPLLAGRGRRNRMVAEATREGRS